MYFPGFLWKETRIDSSGLTPRCRPGEGEGAEISESAKRGSLNRGFKRAGALSEGRRE